MVSIIIYASSNPNYRDKLWSYLQQLGKIIRVARLVVGDVNQPMETAEKHGGRPINKNRAAKLRGVINNCQLIDLGFNGPRFTLINMRQRMEKN